MDGLFETIKQSQYNDDKSFDAISQMLSKANDADFGQIVSKLHAMHKKCSTVPYGNYPSQFVPTIDICTNRLLDSKVENLNTKMVR